MFIEKVLTLELKKKKLYIYLLHLYSCLQQVLFWGSFHITDFPLPSTNPNPNRERLFLEPVFGVSILVCRRNMVMQQLQGIEPVLSVNIKLIQREQKHYNSYFLTFYAHDK